MAVLSFSKRIEGERSPARLLPAALAAVLVLTAFAPIPAWAVTTGEFEIDGNRPDDSGAGDPIDWDTAVAPTVGRTDLTDAFKPTLDDIIGGKNDEPDNWKLDDGSAPAKGDIVDGSVAFRVVNGDEFVYVNFDVLSDDGSVHMDYEFNQSADTFLNSNNENVPKRTENDLIISFDKQGNSLGVKVFEWKPAGAPKCDPSDAIFQCGQFVDITPTLGAADFAGVVAPSLTVPGGNFGEGALNLTVALQDSTGGLLCEQFKKVWMKTRASGEITAALKDRTLQSDLVICDDAEECTIETCNSLVQGLCVFTPAEHSTPCTDDDGNQCTTAGCDGQGSCDQNHIVATCTQDDCNTGTCDTATGLCIPAADSTPCTDTDGNACTTAGCDGAGTCDQSHVFVPDSTACPDGDNDACTTAGCDGNGTCDQSHVTKQCTTDECNTGSCDPASGLCIPVADSTPCTDTDTTDCVIAGCESGGGEVGTCVQAHVARAASSPCPEGDNDACTTAGCDGNGSCNQTHIQKQCTTDQCNTGQCNPATGLCVPQPDSTPCGDTDNNTCTEAGCEVTGEVGSCVQTHVQPDSKPCADTDSNVCTTAGCDGSGTCDQSHITVATSSGQASRAFGVFLAFPLGESILTDPLVPPLNGGPELVDPSPDTDADGSPAQIACVGPGTGCLADTSPVAEVDVLEVEASGSSATATTGAVRLLDDGAGNFLVTAEAVKAVADCDAGATAATTSIRSAGSLLENVTVGDQNFDTISEPTTVVTEVAGLGTATVKFLEKIGDAAHDDPNLKFSSDLEVNAIHVTVTDGSGATVLEVIVGHAECNADFSSIDTCAAVPHVSGHGFVVRVTAEENAAGAGHSTEIGRVDLPATGEDSADATAKHIGPISDGGTTTLVESNTAFSHTEGDVTATGASSKTHSQVEDLRVLDTGTPLVSATVVRADCESSTSSGGSSSGTTTLAAANIGGSDVCTALNLSPTPCPGDPVSDALCCQPPPNTDACTELGISAQCVAAGVSITLNEQTGAASGNPTDITVRAIHVTAVDPVAGDVSSDVIISEAHCDAGVP